VSKGRSACVDWRLAATLVGAVVGAGFATGREVLQFFGLHGSAGYAGLALVTLFLGWFVGNLVRYQHRHSYSTYGVLYRDLTGPLLGTFLDWTTTVFLFLGLSITLAALAALLSQQWSLPELGALALSAAVCLAVTTGGSWGVMRFNGLLVPLLILLLLLVCGVQWFCVPAPPGVRPVGGILTIPVWALGNPDKPATPHWPVSAFLYLAYNVVLLVATLVAVTGEERATGRAADGYVAGWTIGCLALATLTVIEPQAYALVDFDIPLAAIAACHGHLVSNSFTVALALALLTTAVAQVFGSAARLGGRKGTPLVAVAIISAALPMAALGFARLLATIYPLVGLAGAVFVVAFTCAKLSGASDRPS